MVERLRFVARLLDGEKMAVRCREFDISRKTSYKIFNRYKGCALEGLSDGRQKTNLSTVFAGQNVGVKEVSERIWLVTFMDYDLGFFDDETCRLESAIDPFEPKVLPMSPVSTVT